MGEYFYVVTILVKVLAGLLFIGGYLKSRRKSALFLAAGWMTSTVIPFPSAESPFLRYEPLILGISAALSLMGILYLLEEELDRKAPWGLHATIPSIPIAYGMLETLAGKGSNGTYVVVGVLIAMGGALSCEILSPKYKGSGKLFGAVLVITGILSAIKPIVQGYTTMPIERSTEISLVMAILMAAAYYRIILSPRFVEMESLSKVEHRELEEGVLILSPSEFGEFREMLKGYPVLAFIRGEPHEKGWITYRLQTIEGFRNIHPRNLYYIMETTSRYLKEMGEKGRGIVLLDSPEFLRIYNDFPSIMKMLTSLSDMVKSHGGTLIIISSPETWEEREWRILQRALL